MPKALIVTGTDTGIGKTIVAALLTLGLGASYYKPIQSGVTEGQDGETVAALTGLGPARILANGVTLTEPLSPHRAAELDGVVVDPQKLTPPSATDRPLIIEGAGGLMVPVTRSLLLIDLFQQWQSPVLLVARTALGTINHSLLSLEALRARKIPIFGMVFVGDENPDNMRTICDFGHVRCLGHVPMLEQLTKTALQGHFERYFSLSDFKELQ